MLYVLHGKIKQRNWNVGVFLFYKLYSWVLVCCYDIFQSSVASKYPKLNV
jgi:hypothetical protein